MTYQMGEITQQSVTVSNNKDDKGQQRKTTA